MDKEAIHMRTVVKTCFKKTYLYEFNVVSKVQF